MLCCGHLQASRQALKAGSCSTAMRMQRQMALQALEQHSSKQTGCGCGSRSILSRRSSIITCGSRPKSHASSAPSAARAQLSSCLPAAAQVMSTMAMRIWARNLDRRHLQSSAALRPHHDGCCIRRCRHVALTWFMPCTQDAIAMPCHHTHPACSRMGLLDVVMMAQALGSRQRGLQLQTANAQHASANRQPATQQHARADRGSPLQKRPRTAAAAAPLGSTAASGGSPDVPAVFRLAESNIGPDIQTCEQSGGDVF